MALFDCRAYRDEALTKANAEIQLLKRVSVASSCLANLVATRNNRIGLALVQANLGTRGPKAAEAATRGIYMRIGKEVFEQYMNRLNDPAVFKTSTGCYACSDADHSSPRNKGKGRGRGTTSQHQFGGLISKMKVSLTRLGLCNQYKFHTQIFLMTYNTIIQHIYIPSDAVLAQNGPGSPTGGVFSCFAVLLCCWAMMMWLLNWRPWTVRIEARRGLITACYDDVRPDGSHNSCGAWQWPVCLKTVSAHFDNGDADDHNLPCESGSESEPLSPDSALSSYSDSSSSTSSSNMSYWPGTNSP